jgi:cell division protein FtsZ
VDSSVETFVQLVVVLLGGLLILRIALSVPSWFARRRRPETRSILVVGVGGGGGNAVDRMVEAGTPGVGFIACNTDAQALRGSLAGTRIRIGDAITRGLGAGGDPTIGRRAAEEDQEKIARAVSGADLVFVTAGLGGGTGSGAAPIVAAKARDGGALTIGVVTKPFAFEGTQRMEIAEEAAAKLLAEVDALITVPNEHVSDVIREEAPALEAFRVVDEVLLQAAEGIIHLLHTPGLINLDFADVRAVVQNAGPALIGIGRGFGPERAVAAARQAVSSPLLEARMRGAHGILFHVAGPADLRLNEVRLAADEIRAAADPHANVIFGASLSGAVDDEVVITLIATGLDPAVAESEERADRKALARAGHGAWRTQLSEQTPASAPLAPVPASAPLAPAPAAAEVAPAPAAAEVAPAAAAAEVARARAPLTPAMRPRLLGLGVTSSTSIAEEPAVEPSTAPASSASPVSPASPVPSASPTSPASPASTAVLHPRSAASTRTATSRTATTRTASARSTDRRRGSHREPPPPTGDDLDLPTFLRNRSSASIR